MNTFLLQSDNTIIQSEKTIIVEKSNNVDSVQFICEKFYNDLDMSSFDLVMEYVMPISKDVKIATLVLVDDNYKEDYLLYKLPMTAANITGETGRVAMNLSFLKIEYDADGNGTKYARNFTPAFLNIVPLSTFFSVTDTGLSQLAELYLNNKAQIIALQEVAQSLAISTPNDLDLDDDGILKLAVDGEPIGNGVSVTKLTIEESELDGVNDGILDVDVIVDDKKEENEEEKNPEDDDFLVLDTLV